MEFGKTFGWLGWLPLVVLVALVVAAAVGTFLGF